MNESTTSQAQPTEPQLPIEPNDEIFNDTSRGTMGMYLKEVELYDIFLRVQIYVEDKFKVNTGENLPPQ